MSSTGLYSTRIKITEENCLIHFFPRSLTTALLYMDEPEQITKY